LGIAISENSFKYKKGMKILQLCHKPPMPARDGGCIAMNNITQGLLMGGHRVKVLTIFTAKHDLDLDSLSEDYLNATRIEGVFVDTEVNMVDAFSSYITSDSYNVNRFFSVDFDIRLTTILKREQFDVVHLESLFMTPYVATIKRYTQTPVILRSHNLEFIIWEKIARGTRNPFKRIYLSYLARKLREYELSAMNHVHGIAAISDEDRKRYLDLGVRKPICTVPFGINPDDYASSDDASELALFHLGAMDWSPNVEGIRWFLDSIWPAIHLKFPELKLYLAGRNMPAEFLDRRDPNVVFCGDVPDARAFVKSKKIMIVPLLSAGGIRVKIIEGMALGKLVISTTLGADGLNCMDGVQLMLADRKEQWLEKLEMLLGDADLRDRLAQNAIRHIHSNFTLQAVTAKLISFYKELKKS
jgi:glycosyltransferase involved in cell wall biosynthesis